MISFGLTRRDDSQRRCLGCSSLVVTSLGYQGIDRHIFLHSSHHFDGDWFSSVGFRLITSEFVEDVVDAVEFNATLLL